MASTSRAVTLFSEAAKAERVAPRVYRVNLCGDYCIGLVPNGGYTGACMLAAASDHLSSRGQKDTLTVHFEYPSRTTEGEAIVTIDEVRLGESMSTLQLTLWQGGLLPQAPWITPNFSRRIVLAYSKHVNLLSFEGLSLPTGFEHSLEAETTPTPDFSALKSQGRDENWTEQRIPMAAKVARSLGRWHLYLPRSGPLVPGVLHTWMRLSTGERIRQGALTFVVDTFPFDLHAYLAAPELRKMLLPQTQDKKDHNENTEHLTPEEAAEERAAFWFPTLVLNMEAKTPLPEEGVEWLMMRVTSKQMRHGKFDIEVLIRDVDGEFIALAHQVFMIVSMDKNTARRVPEKAAL